MPWQTAAATTHAHVVNEAGKSSRSIAVAVEQRELAANEVLLEVEGLHTQFLQNRA